MLPHQVLLASEAGIGAPDLARLAAVAQADPSTHIGYFAFDETCIAEEIGEVAGWPDTTAVALGPDGFRGWLLAETDDEVGRIWWWVFRRPPHRTAPTKRLITTASTRLRTPWAKPYLSRSMARTPLLDMPAWTILS